jgi:hypothetical protein
MRLTAVPTRISHSALPTRISHPQECPQPFTWPTVDASLLPADQGL